VLVTQRRLQAQERTHEGVAGAETPLLRAIAYGIRAPNPHNTQAWRFKRVSESEALLFIDERRLLPATDPPARQIHIGAGCCIETLAVGMSLHGYETEVEYLPAGAHGLEEIGRKPVARITLVPDRATPQDRLAEFISQRQTNRKPYEGPLLSTDEEATLRAEAESDDFELLIIRQPEPMRPLLDVFYRAWEIEATTPHLYEETRIWFRFNEEQRQRKRDGLSIPQLGIDGLRRRLTEWTLRNGDPKRWFSSLSIRSTLRSNRKAIESAKGVVLLKTATNEQLDWLKADAASLASRSPSPDSVSPPSPSARSCRSTRRWPNSRRASTRCSTSANPRRSRWRSGSAGPSEPTPRRAETRTISFATGWCPHRSNRSA
jgi:hypothetical protein